MYQSQTTKLQKVKNRTVRVVMNKTYETPCAELFKTV